MSHSPLPALLRDPATVASFTPACWEAVLGQARRAGLLARLGVLLEEHGLLERVDPAPRRHLQAALRVVGQQHREVRWEVDRVCRALAGLDVVPVLLKGAAYVMAKLPPARGRMLTDVDVMLPRKLLPQAEGALLLHGWISTKQDPYDNRYYREWMHELPPLRHIERQAILDVHHTIVPLTTRARVDATSLLEAAVPVPGHAGLRMLAPVDMVLHSAAHLFQEGEFEHGLRDVADLDGLLRHFADGPAFWETLIERAAVMRLGRPLHFAVEHATRLLATPVPRAAREALAHFRPAFPADHLMSALLDTALEPDHPSCDGPFTPLARWLLYVRGHYLRMPLHLLLPHLVRKGTRRGKKP